MHSTTWKTNIKHIGATTGVMLGIWSFVSGLLMGLFGFVNPATFGPEQALDPLPALFLVCLLNVLVVTWFVNRSRLIGFRLAMVVFVIIFGVMFFMTQIETIYFNSSIQMPWQVIISTVITGLVTGLVVAWLSARLKRKIGVVEQANIQTKSSGESLVNTVWKFAALSLVYVVFYFSFGYFIAWQFPELREFYSGSREILPFLAHMQQQIATDPWLILFQIIRGILWVAIGYSVAVNIMQVKYWEKIILVGLMLSVGLATPLLVPNEYMPRVVRFGHFFELLIENFLFGVLVVLLFQTPLRSYEST